MTVLQQIRDYYSHLVQPSPEAAKRLMERVLTADGIKTHPAPRDYYAGRLQNLNTMDTVLRPQRLLSEQA